MAEAEAGGGSHKLRRAATSEAGSADVQREQAPRAPCSQPPASGAGDDTRPLSPASPTVGLRCVARGDPHTSVPPQLRGGGLSMSF